MKSTPGVNFTNALLAAFTLVDPESIKNTVKSSVSFMLLGSGRVKAVCRMLMKLSLGVNFVNILTQSFCAKRQSSHQCLFTFLGSAFAKAARKTLVKLTPSLLLSIPNESFLILSKCCFVFGTCLKKVIPNSFDKTKHSPNSFFLLDICFSKFSLKLILVCFFNENNHNIKCIFIPFWNLHFHFINLE